MSKAIELARGSLVKLTLWAVPGCILAALLCPSVLAVEIAAASESESKVIASSAKITGTRISRYVVASGGGASSGGVFSVAGSVGQIDSDPLDPARGGAFAITGGFWSGSAPTTPVSDPIFANGFERAPP